MDIEHTRYDCLSAEDKTAAARAFRRVLARHGWAISLTEDTPPKLRVLVGDSNIFPNVPLDRKQEGIFSTVELMASTLTAQLWAEREADAPFLGDDDDGGRVQ